MQEQWKQYKNEKSELVKVLITREFSSEFIGSTLMFGNLENGRLVTLKFSKIKGGAKREYAGLLLAYNKGVNVPQPIMLITRDEEPNMGIVMETINGKTLSSLSTPENRIGLGNEVKKLHQINVIGFGVITQGIPDFIDADLYMHSWFHKILPYLEKNSEGSKLMNGLWLKVRQSTISRKPVFISRDINDNNTIVDEHGKITLCDFEWWQGGDSTDDVGIYLYHNIRLNKPEIEFNQFLQGYTDGAKLSESQELDLLFHVLFAAGRVVSFCARFNQTRLDEAQEDMKKVTEFVKLALNKN